MRNLLPTPARTPERAGRPETVSRFYEERQDRQQELAGARALRTTDPDAFSKRMQEGGTYAGDPFAKALQASRDAVTRIQNDKAMSPDDKRAAIDLTYLSMIELARRGLEVFEQTKRKPKGYVRGGLVTGYSAGMALQ